MRIVMLRVALLIGLLGSLTAVAAARPARQVDPSGGFTFALIGDLGYNSRQEPLFQAVLDDLNATPDLSFVVHDGDLWGAGCADARYMGRLEQFNASVHPFIFTPGDNDWTDCHGSGFDPVDRLNLERRVFFSDGFSLGQQRLPVERQSDDPAYALYRENLRWRYGGVTFLTLNVPGSENNFGRTPEMDAEATARMAANLAWLQQGFDLATETNSLAIMIVWQADPGFDRRPGRNEPFQPLLDALQEHALAFVKPVVLVHGDSHYFRIDKPLPTGPRNGEATVANFTRVETFGQPDHHWLSVTVDPEDPSVFTFRQRIVEANRGCGAANGPC
ncbi:MAG: hypothetical protein QOF51_556 [Chloroflexota bacterium]|nr:hypothetical protein [Chloroflexota bacterium]